MPTPTVIGEVIAVAQIVLTDKLQTLYHALVAWYLMYNYVHVHLQTPGYYVKCGYRDSRSHGFTSYVHLPQGGV